MKDKNRFSILLEHLMAIAELKNSILAKAVQYDDSYISKWISGKLLPTEKNHENTLQAISHCIVEALSEESTAQLLQEYQLQDINDLETAIYDNLKSEYMYVKELQNSTGTEVAPKISYYPELTLDQFIFKMKHPSNPCRNKLNDCQNYSNCSAEFILSLFHLSPSAMSVRCIFSIGMSFLSSHIISFIRRSPAPRSFVLLTHIL